MRYSKGRVVLTTIISISCFVLVVFAIYKGIEFAKKANESGKTIKADVTEVKKETTKKTTKDVTKKVTDETTKKNTNQTSSKTQTTTKTETKVEEKQSVQKEEKVVTKPDTKLSGKYEIKKLNYQGKKYSKKEIRKLIDGGYSMSLEIVDGEVAIVSVLSINHTYLIDGSYFNDGASKIEYTYKNKRIKVTIDGAEMLFIKK